MLYLDIFSRNYINRYPVTGINIPLDLEYLRNTYEYNKSIVEDYYLSRNFSVNNTNIISRMLDHLPQMLHNDLYDLVPVAEDRFKHLCKTFGITNGISRGDVQPPYFYGNGGESIIVGGGSWSSPKDVKDNWKRFKCINTITHPRNDLNLLLPSGTDDGCKGGLSGISIDGLSLTIKYREFLREQMSRVEEGYTGPILNKNQFVSKYVLPGILESYIDHTFLNRVMDRFYGNPIITPKYKSKAIIRTPERQVDRYCDEILNYITRKSIDFVNILNNIPLMFTPTASLLLSFDGLPDTRQSNWAFITTRLKYMIFLYDVSKDTYLSKGFIADWKLLAKRIDSAKGQFDHLPLHLKEEVFEQLYKIKNM